MRPLRQKGDQGSVETMLIGFANSVAPSEPINVVPAAINFLRNLPRSY